ncbi:MAG: LysR family transcriptional regulator [Chloroflexota bacterium]
MELRQLEVFVAVAEELHFSRAAERLHVAQPSVSEQIRALERELGLPLFERTSRAVALTAAGRDILPLAIDLLKGASELRLQAQQSARRLAGRVRIGFLADEYMSPTGQELMASVRRLHPRLDIEFLQVDFADHHRAIEDGRVDVAFVMGPVPRTLVSVAIARAPRLLAVSRSGREEAGREEGEPGEAAAAGGLDGQAVVLPNQMAATAWRRAWTPPRWPSGHVFVVGESRMEAMLAAVGARRGVAVVPEYVSRYYPQPGVVFERVAGLGPCSVEIAALRTRQADPEVAAFLEVARGLEGSGGRAGSAGTAGSAGGAAPPG